MEFLVYIKCQRSKSVEEFHSLCLKVSPAKSRVQIKLFRIQAQQIPNCPVVANSWMRLPGLLCVSSTSVSPNSKYVILSLELPLTPLGPSLLPGNSKEWLSEIPSLYLSKSCTDLKSIYFFPFGIRTFPFLRFIWFYLLTR